MDPETMPIEKKPLWIPPRRHPILEQFFEQPTIRDHPNYNEMPIKSFERNCRFHAGIEQVSLLTKTKAIQGLPSLIASNQNYILNDNNVH